MGRTYHSIAPLTVCNVSQSHLYREPPMLSRFKINNPFLRYCPLRKSCCVWLIAAGILVSATGSLEAATYYVRTDGNDANAGTGPDAANAWATVAAAVTKSLSAGDIVYVKSGNYSGLVNPSVNGTAANPVKFIADSAGTVSDWAPGNVVLSASGPNRSLEISRDYLQFIGFHLEGATGQDVVLISSGTGIVLEKCELFNSGKDGIQLDNGSVTVINCLLRDNGGDGIKVLNGNCTVWNTTIVNCANGVEIEAGSVTVTNSIIYNNSSDGLDVNGGTMTHTYNLIYGSGSNNWEGTGPSTGEISVDPLFVSTTDFHLRSTSPGRDAGVSAPGTVDDDFHGNPRPENSSWDMGYHEYAATRGYTPLLLVTANNGYVSTQERHRKTLFEAWDYSVTTIWAGDTQLNFDTSLGTVAVAYVTEEVNSGDLAYKLRETTVGVVNSEPALTDELGVATLTAGTVSDNVMNVADNTHYITSSFALGSLTLFSSAQDANFLDGTIAPGAQVLGDWSGSGTLAAIDTGATLATTYNSSNVASGRRVQLPFGSSAFDFASLTEDGQTLVQRALEWASAGLVGHWTFDEGAGTTIADSSVFSNDASFTTGTPTWVSGVRNSGLQFDGSNNGATNSTFAPPSIGSVAFWFRSDGLPSGTERLFGTGGNWEVRIEPTGEVYFDLGGESNGTQFHTDPGTAGTGKWRHVVALFNASTDTFSLYVDGEFVKSGTINLNPQSAALLSLGTRTGSSERFDGALDDLRIFNRELSATEVAELYGLVGHWKMDEGGGATAADSTAYGNDATLSGATWTTDCVGNIGLEFDGLGDTAATSSSFDPPEEGTVALWFRSAGPPAARQRPWGVGSDYEMWQDPDGLVSCDVSTDGFQGGFITDEPLHREDRWYHLIAQYDSKDDSYAIYINGELHKSGISTWAMTKQTANTLTFGTRTGSTEYFEGAIRDFRIYNRALFGHEISELSGLIALWKLDETSGTVAADSSPNGYDGTLYGNPVWTTAGNIDGALDFETTDGVDFVDAGNFDVSGDQLSIAAWVKPENGVTDGRIVIKSTGNALVDQYWGMAVGASLELDFRLKAGGTTDFFTEVNVLSPGKWHHVAGTYDGTTMQMYVNGNEVGSIVHTVGGTLDVDDTVPVILGDSPVGGRAYDGRLDDVRVLSRVMCPEEIRGLYKGGRPAGIRILKWVEVR